MKRRFKVTVDGKTYTVEVEELTEMLYPKLGSSPRTRSSVKVHEAIETPWAQSESEVITAPLPGMVTSILVTKGDAVESGRVLLILEAMKMENEIHASANGTVEEIYVDVGEQVGRGAPLIMIS